MPRASESQRLRVLVVDEPTADVQRRVSGPGGALRRRGPCTAERPAVQQLELQPQLLDLALRGPIARVGDRAGGEAIDEGDE